MDMQTEPATVILEQSDLLVVSRDADNQEIEFVKKKDIWMLKNGCNSSSLLYGTHFIYKE